MYIYLIGVLEQFNLLSLFGCCIDRVSFPGSEPRKTGTNNRIKNRQQQQQHMAFSFQRPILWLQPLLVAIWLSLQSFSIVGTCPSFVLLSTNPKFISFIDMLCI